MRAFSSARDAWEPNPEDLLSSASQPFGRGGETASIALRHSQQRSSDEVDQAGRDDTPERTSLPNLHQLLGRAHTSDCSPPHQQQQTAWHATVAGRAQMLLTPRDLALMPLPTPCDSPDIHSLPGTLPRLPTAPQPQTQPRPPLSTPTAVASEQPSPGVYRRILAKCPQQGCNQSDRLQPAPAAGGSLEGVIPTRCPRSAGARAAASADACTTSVPSAAAAAACHVLSVSPHLPPAMSRRRWRLRDFSGVREMHHGHASCVFQAICLRR